VGTIRKTTLKEGLNKKSDCQFFKIANPEELRASATSLHNHDRSEGENYALKDAMRKISRECREAVAMNPHYDRKTSS
jgi:lysyl-tRNA synthetase class II